MKPIKKRKRNILTLFALAFVALSFSACTTKTTQTSVETATSYNGPKAKYVFFFIGDGMAMPQINMAEAALNQMNKAGTIGIGNLNMRQLEVAGVANTHAENRYITGSAAAATALATGNKTTINTISMNGDHTKELKTIAERAKANGKKVGIITSVSIDHATPACFYAHTPNRGNYEEIANQLIKSDFDYFAGGTVKHGSFKKQAYDGTGVKVGGNHMTYDEYKAKLKKVGFTFTNTRADFEKLTPASGRCVSTIKLFDTYTKSSCSLPYSIDLPAVKDSDNTITLAEFTQKGIELLENEKGFFMMVEGGKIDWAGHANDVATNVREVLAFDQAIGKALAFYKKHPKETLIIVTGDHECGGLTLGFSGTHYNTSFGFVLNQKMSYETFTNRVKELKEAKKFTLKRALAEAKENFGLGNEKLGLALSDYEVDRLKDAYKATMNEKNKKLSHEKDLIYGSYDPFTVTCTHLLANKAGVNWGSFSHTALPVSVFAVGAGEDLFKGYFDNTDIPKRIAIAGGYKD